MKRIVSAFCAVALTSTAATAQLSLTVDKSTVGAGEQFLIQITGGTPGDAILLMISSTLGPTPFPKIGAIDIGVPEVYFLPGFVDPSGIVNMPCDLSCAQITPNLTTLHYQALAFDPSIPFLPVTGKTNVMSLTYDPALYNDCNGNGLNDTCDIRDGFSQDVNLDGVPDECVDCDNDGNPDGPNVSGRVWHDLNADGVEDVEDPGVADVIVTAFDNAGNVVGGTSTDSDGRYTLAGVADSNGIRVEFSDLPSWLAVAPSANGTGKEIQFIEGQTCDADLALFAPAEICVEGVSACLATPCYINGDATAGGSAGTGDVLVRMPYGATGAGQNTYLGAASDLGALWGLGYRRSTDTLFAASFVKRHVGFGPGGIDAIYSIEQARFGAPNPTANVAVWLNVNTFPGVDVGAVNRPDLPAAISGASFDLAAYESVGKAGLGGLAISEDDRTLYAVNLFQREVLEIDIDSKALLNRYPVDTGINCVDGVARPFAVTFWRGDLYVGVTCTGEINGQTAIIESRVRRLDNGVFTDVLSVPLDYQRGQAYVVCPFTGWFPWISGFFPACGSGIAVFPQPILADLAFDNDGCLSLGFIDRFGHQTGFKNLGLSGAQLYDGFSGGDLLRACSEGGSLVLESNGTAGGVTTAGAGNNEGPGGGEFFHGDQWSVAGNVSHFEVTLGGVAVLPGSGETATTTFDPISGSPSEIRTGGVRRLSTTTGDTIAAYKVFATDTPGTSGKAAGLGDLELLCSAPPIEIGDRVFVDADGDGVQSADEDGLGGVVVQLVRNGSVVDMTSSAADGSFTFSGLIPNDGGYAVRVDLSQAALSTFHPSPVDAGGDDLADSDGDPSVTAGFVTASLGAEGPGRTNFSIDFGFVPN